MSKNKSKKVFKCFEEFKKYYFPKTYEEDRLKNLTPSDLGKEMASKTIEKIFKRKKFENNGY